MKLLYALRAATNVTSRILKAKSQREGQNKALGAPVHPSKFSAYVSSVCRAEKDWNTNLERFTVNEAVKRNLRRPSREHLRGKAVGPDGVSVEMLAANAEGYDRADAIVACEEALAYMNEKGLPQQQQLLANNPIEHYWKRPKPTSKRDKPRRQISEKRLGRRAHGRRLRTQPVAERKAQRSRR